MTADDLSGETTQQTRDVLARIDTYLAKAGSDKSRILSATVWLRDIERRLGRFCRSRRLGTAGAGYMCVRCIPWRLAETPIASSSWGGARSEATRRRPQDPCRDLRALMRCRILLCCTLRLRLRHGSQGLRDVASLLLRPGMTKLRKASVNRECL
ncbi:Rid family hydrolase [Mesorhizobium sp.]|nr:Rid family hydrolase [Mesorhizobium sp.]